MDTEHDRETTNRQNWNRTLKRLFNLTTTTPTAAILHNFGLLYMTQSMDQKQFMYLHKILNRESDHWTKKMLVQLKTLELGWAKYMTEKLMEYQLEQDWENIRRKTKAEWRKIVDEAIEENNRKKLIKNCTTKTSNGFKVNTKTKTIPRQKQSMKILLPHPISDNHSKKFLKEQNREHKHYSLRATAC